MVKKIHPIEIDAAAVYRFNGNGAGIPGLPHEVTAAQAADLGLREVLQAAIQNGTYRAERPVPTELEKGA
jgi:hypothetical protein